MTDARGWQALTRVLRDTLDTELGLAVAFVRDVPDISSTSSSIDAVRCVCAVDDVWKDNIRAALLVEDSVGPGSAGVAPSSPSAPRTSGPLARRTTTDDLILPDLLLVTVIERNKRDRPLLKRFVASSTTSNGPATTVKQYLRDRDTGSSSTRAETCAEAFGSDMGSEISETADGMSDESWFNKFVAAFAPRAFHLSYSTRGGTQPKQFRPLLVGRSSGFQSHPNLDGLVMTVTTDSYRFLFSHYVEQTLADVVNFHAEAVASSATKRALLTKQLLSSFDEMHRKRGYTHGSFSSKDVLVDQNLWITVGGWERQALVPTRTLLSSPAPETQLDNFTARWCGGEISNFDYIMELNRLAGRHFGDPSLHPIMPWVTDFTGSEPSSGRRDLSKSKYRLNKGDEQLDWQFMETTPGSTPHHITHLLSDVTYFVYLARRTPVPVLRKFVRSKYEPNEYPVSVRRVFDWTPDECIPEFYSDPTIFASLHADMPDLQLPEWAPSPVDFVAKHREALESDWVSESLHEWIDLAFGYKLTGQAAVESKNVALPLAGSGSGSAMVDRMTKHGIHQLFTGPHPQKAAGTTRHEETTVDALADALQGSFNSRPQTVRERFSNAFAALSIPPPSTPSRKGSPPPAGGSPADFRKGHDRKPSQPPIPNVIRHQRSVSRNEYFDLAQQVPQQQALAAPGSPQMVSMEIAASPDLQNSSITSELYPELASSRKIRIAGDTDFAEPVGAFENVNDFKSSLRSAALEPVVPEVLTELEKIPSRINLQTTPIESATGFGLAAAKDVADLGRVLLQLAALPESRDQITTTVQPFRIEAAVKEALESGSAAKLEEALATAPRTFRGPLRAMLSPTWSKRPTVSVLLQDSSSPLVYDPSTTFPFPGSANVLYDYVAQYEASHGKELVLLTVQNLDTLSRLEDEPFQFLLPYILPLFTTPTLCCDSWTLLFDRLAARIGPEMTQAKLLKPLAALFEPTCNEPGISKVLFSASFLKQLVRRFGLLAFCEKVLPLYIPDALQAWVNTSAASSSSAPTAEDLKDSATSVIEAALGIASQLGPILTGKYVTQPLLSVVLRDPSCAPILHYLVVLMGSRFGELFIVHQFFPVLKASLDKAHKAGGPVTNKYVTVVNSLSLLEKFANHLTATSLVAEMTEMVPTLSRLIESLTSAELDYGDEQRKVICVRAFSYLVRLSDLLNGHADWRPQILPILIRFFAGAVRFVGQSRKATDPTRPNLSIYSPEVVGQVFAGFQALLGRDLLTRVPTSSSIERMLKERPSDEDRVYEEQLSAVVTRSNSSAIFESNYWVGDQPTKPKIGRSASMPLSPGGGSNGIGSLPGSRKTSPNDSTASDSKLPSAASLSAIGERLADVSDFTLSLDNVLTRPFKASDAKARGPPRPRSEATEDRAAWARLLSTTNEVSRETTEMTFRDLKLRTYVGHGSRVNVVAQDECSRLLATGSRDRTVKLWSLNSIHRDIENGLSNSDAAHTYTAHQRSVSDVAFLDSSLVTCDGSVHLWSIETGQLMHQFEVKNRVVSLLATPSVLIGATVDNFLSFWSVKDQSRVHRWRAGNAHAGNIRCIAICPSEKTIVVGFATGVCSLLDRRTGMLLASWRAHEGDVNQVAFYTSRFVVTSCGADRSVNIWDTTNLTSVRTFRDSNEIASFQIQEDDLVILGAAGSGLNFVSLSSNFQSYFAKLKTRSAITSLGLSRMNGLFVLGCAEGEVVVYA